MGQALKNLAPENNPYGVTEIDANGSMQADPNIATVKDGKVVLQRISECWQTDSLRPEGRQAPCFSALFK